MHRVLSSFVSFVVAIAALAGCGGSNATPVVETVHSDRDGVVFSLSGVVNVDGSEMSVGDNASDVTLQSLVSFPLSLPEGSAIRKAVLRLHGASSFGPTNPHLTEPVLVEHLHADFGEFDSTDFATAPAELTSCGEMGTVVDWNELDVTTSVRQDLAAGRGFSQFRLYRARLTDSDAAWDYNGFYTSESATDQPELVVTYVP